MILWWAMILLLLVHWNRAEMKMHSGRRFFLQFLIFYSFVEFFEIPHFCLWRGKKICIHTDFVIWRAKKIYIYSHAYLCSEMRMIKNLFYSSKTKISKNTNLFSSSKTKMRNFNFRYEKFYSIILKSCNGVLYKTSYSCKNYGLSFFSKLFSFLSVLCTIDFSYHF